MVNIQTETTWKHNRTEAVTNMCRENIDKGLDNKVIRLFFYSVW